MLGLILWSLFAVALYMSGVFVIALVKKDNSVVDIAWGLGFILVAGVSLYLDRGITARKLLVNLLVVLWGARLAVHILVRGRGRGEDFRYAQWRHRWGKWFIPRTYLQVFMLQGLLLVVIVYPVILVNHSRKTSLNLLDAAGALIWSIGFFFEAVGDYELLSFKRNPANKGKIMNRGLWRYTRHPNYFGEATMWWGIFFIALSLPDGWTSVFSPLLITFLLLRVSGVIMLEKRYAGNAEYAAYSRKTSAFVPWPPKN